MHEFSPQQKKRVLFYLSFFSSTQSASHTQKYSIFNGLTPSAITFVFLAPIAIILLVSLRIRLLSILSVTNLLALIHFHSNLSEDLFSFHFFAPIASRVEWSIQWHLHLKMSIYCSIFGMWISPNLAFEAFLWTSLLQLGNSVSISLFWAKNKIEPRVRWVFEIPCIRNDPGWHFKSDL